MNIALHTNDATAMQRIAQLLDAAGARCQCFGTPEGVMHATHHGGFDIALIDTRHSREADDTLLAWVRGRAAAATTAIVLLSSDSRSESVVRALEAGADDVVLMPSPPEVIAARMRAVHRRARQVNEDHHRVQLAGYTLDRNTGGVQDRDRPVHLTPREFSIAWFLFSRPCSFVSRDSIGMAVWGLQADIAEHTIEQHIYMLRKKMQLSRDRGVWIRAAYGRGYRLEVRAAAARAPVDDGPHAGALAMVHAMETAWPRG